MKTVKSVSVVGGGTAGLVSALILKQSFGDNINIKIIKSDKIGIIGVGEGSTEHWATFMKHLGLSTLQLIKETDATFKSGIYFQNWSSDDFLHSVAYGYDGSYNGIPVVYGTMIKNKTKKLDMCPSNYINNTVNRWFLEQNYKETDPIIGELVNQFHFNTNKLNVFLQKLCVQKNIEIIEDEIVDVLLHDDGSIKSLKGNKTNYQSDFYIDSTGLKRLLISKLGAKWQSYSKYLTLNSAIAFQTEDTEEYNMYTLARAMDYGWMWRIPTYGRWGNGYVFNDEYINFDQAKQEVEQLLDRKIEVGKKIKFDPGALDKVWIKNCVAVGLSANFVEPLEATSISTSIQQAFLLVNAISNYNEEVSEDYNNKVNDIMINIRDFIILHYITNKEDSEFWKDIKYRAIPETLSKKLTLWKNKLPDENDFKGSKLLFKQLNHILVMYGLDLLDTNMVKDKINLINDDIKKDISNIISERNKHFDNMKTIGHKEFLTQMRNLT
jgi:flavin-dependent dehydrogenase